MNRNLLTGVFLLLCLLLIVSESQACDDTAPLAKLSNPFHQHVCVGEGVNFDAIGGAVHGSHDPDNGSPYGEGHGISIYGWYYGDGGGWNYTDGGTPTHTYDSPGLYTVYLYVYDDDEGTRSEDYDYCMVYVDEVDSVVKIDPGPEEEGHVYILLGDYVLLEAKKFPHDGPFPKWNPTWAIIDTEPDGLTASLQPVCIGEFYPLAVLGSFSDLGDYIIEAKCGNDDPGDNTITVTVVEPPEVEILDAFDKPGAELTILFANGSRTTSVSAILTPAMSGRQIDFTKESGSGSVDPSSADTDAQGKAVTTLTAATSTGKTVVKAAFHDAPSESDSAVVYMYKHSVSPSKDFDFNTIISNTELTVTPTSLDTQAEIESWLESKSSGLAGMEYGGELISQIIHDSRTTYNINVQVILVTLQKEKTLISDPNPSQAKLNHAMGYGSSSNIRDQIQDGTSCFRNHYNNAPAMPYIYPIGPTASLSINYYDSTDGIQKVRVKINNAATYSLYRYTNYIRDQAAGGANYLFYDLWDQYGF